jgi:hypothetical protein
MARKIDRGNVNVRAKNIALRVMQLLQEKKKRLYDKNDFPIAE